MKRTIALLMALLICLSFSSCQVTELPAHSDNFDSVFIKSFFTNYSPADPQLYYFSASPWEAEFGEGSDKYLLAGIENTDPADFVSLSKYTFFIGKPAVDIRIYQSQSAPNPMADWTINSITLLSGNLPFVPNDVNNVSESDYAQKVMEYNLSVSDEVKVFARREWRELLNFVAESYKTSYSSPGRNFKSVCKYEEDGVPGESYEEYTRYYLLVRFEESSNIVWLTQLYHENGELYFTHGIRQYEYCALGSNYSQTIAEFIGFKLTSDDTTNYNE